MSLPIPIQNACFKTHRHPGARSPRGGYSDRTSRNSTKKTRHPGRRVTCRRRGTKTVGLRSSNRAALDEKIQTFRKRDDYAEPAWCPDLETYPKSVRAFVQSSAAPAPCCSSAWRAAVALSLSRRFTGTTSTPRTSAVQQPLSSTGLIRKQKTHLTVSS